MFHQERKVLQSIFQNWDISKCELEQSLQYIPNRLAFKKIIMYLITCEPEIIYKHRYVILSWIKNGVDPFFECIPLLTHIFKLIIDFQKSSTSFKVEEKKTISK